MSVLYQRLDTLLIFAVIIPTKRGREREIEIERGGEEENEWGRGGQREIMREGESDREVAGGGGGGDRQSVKLKEGEKECGERGEGGWGGGGEGGGRRR